MKKLAKSSIKGLLLALVLALISGIGAVTASAGTLTADLDGDGKKEQIVWDEDDPDTITVNSTEVLKAADVSSADFYPDYFEVSVIDTCKKDKYKENHPCQYANIQLDKLLILLFSHMYNL